METRFGDPDVARAIRARVKLPVVVAPMFLVSGPELVIASSRSGVIGVLPSLNARSSELFDDMLGRIRSELDGATGAAPYAVNIIAHKTNQRLAADVDICVKHSVPLIISSVGSPVGIIEKVRNYGGYVFSDAASVKHARKAAEIGVDGLVLLCAGAGGNTGWLNPFAFVSEVRRFFAGPIVLAGAISRGQFVHVAEAMGADFASVGTSFIAARESMAADAYRQMLIRCSADDIVLTSAVSGIPANMLRESLELAGYGESKPRQGFDLSHELTTLTAWRDIWSAGHGVGDVTAVESVAEIVSRFQSDYTAARQGAIDDRMFELAISATGLARSPLVRDRYTNRSAAFNKEEPIGLKCT